MTEMYTKPFKSVQDAITFFEHRIDQNKNCSCSNKEGKEREYLKDFTNSRLQLEAKVLEKDLTFFEFDASHKGSEELLAWLKLYKAEADKYEEKIRKAQELFLEFEKADESIIDAQKQPEMMKTTIIVEKEMGQDLLIHTSEIKKVIFSSQLLPVDAEVFQSQKQLDVLTRQFEEMKDLEKELLKQVIIAEYLHMELQQSKEAQAISSNSTSSAIYELGLVKSEAEKMKLISFERANYIIEIEEEGKIMTEQLKISLEKMDGINSQIEMLVGEIHRMQEEISKSSKRELELQEKVSTLTSELRNSAEEAEVEEAKKGNLDKNKEYAASCKTSAFTDADSNGFHTCIVISIEEYNMLIQKSKIADNIKSLQNDGHEANELQRELKDKNAEISELTYRLEETLRRAEMAEKAKIAVEDQLRMWREQKRLRRATSEALKEYATKNPEAISQHKKPWLQKQAYSKPETHDVPSIPDRTLSMHNQSKYTPLGKFLKIKL